ncbi:MAG: hypothetical protein QY316_12840 [Thermodesulfobacteriota bacterium]|nr:MAG: hypothetical protein QY316_12840 [Thermodesulfobacteriota bacterium]
MLIYRIILAALLAALLASGGASAAGKGELPNLSGGPIDGNLAGIDVYNKMRAFCNEEGGRPLAVVSKRFGGFVRLVEVTPDDAAEHIASGGEGKYPWYLACEGDSRFIVEKDYRYSPGEPEKFHLSRGRGLEWLDYIKAEEPEKIARLEARSVKAEKTEARENTRLLEEVALQASSLRMDFVRAVNGARYEAKYNSVEKAGACSRVTVKYEAQGPSGEKFFDYRVCGQDVALIREGFPAGPRGPVALITR